MTLLGRRDAVVVHQDAICDRITDEATVGAQVDDNDIVVPADHSSRAGAPSDLSL